MKRRLLHPMTRLALAMGVAARDISLARVRRQARRDAESIPVCNSELGGGRRGEMARLGRKTLMSLPDLPIEDLADAAIILRGCRDAVMSRFEVTSEIKLGDRRPSAA